MPLQSFAQRTVSHLPHGIRRSLLKLTRPSSPTISQRQPKSKRVVVDAFCITGGWPSPQRFWRSWFGLNLAWCLLQRLIAGSRGPLCFRPDPKVLPSALWTPLLGFIKDRPSASTDVVRSLPGGPRPALWSVVATLRTRSALAVLPDFGGLLRSTPCRFVAPCIRPWGSPSFRSAPALPEGTGWGLAFPCGASPFEVFPSAAGRCASPHAGSLSPLLGASGRGSSRVATFGPAPVRSSPDLRALLRCEVRCEPAGVSTDRLPDTPLGLVPCWF